MGMAGSLDKGAGLRVGMRALQVAVFGFAFLCAKTSQGATAARPWERPEYRQIHARLVRGWGTWDSRNLLEEVLLPEGLAVQLGFKQTTWIGNEYLESALIGRSGPEAEIVRPGLHALDGSYSEFELRWRDVHVHIEAATEGDDVVLLVTPLDKPKLPIAAIVQIGMLWDRPGLLERQGKVLRAKTPKRVVDVYATGEAVDDPYVPARTPYLAIPLRGALGVSTGRLRTVGEISTVLARRRKALEEQGRAAGELTDTALAVEAGLAWNTIYEPANNRIVSTVGRLWNEEYGGYCLFGWDNFFLAYMSAYFSRDLAFANFIEHLRSMTDEGFIPNDDRGNGTKSWDHSQPPVGALLLKEIYKRYPERWLLEACFDDLLRWNRWWMTARSNGPLLSYGSGVAQNPYGDPDVHSRVTAGYESGMDDSPMYEGVPFDANHNVLELQDVGLNSLYVADCKALAEIAVLLGRRDEADELRDRAARISTALDTLWDEKTGIYLNRRTDTGALSPRLSPTLFYPMLAGIPDNRRALEMIKKHFLNDQEFHGEFMLPSTARNDPSFPRQRYWKGAVWPPLNFLVYVGLRKYGFKAEEKELVRSSEAMFLRQWRQDGFVSENYSSISGSGMDPRLSSDRFHSWGALMGFLSLMEAGQMPAPEASLSSTAPSKGLHR